MAIKDFFKRAKNNGKKPGGINFSTRFQQLFLQRIGIVNSYDNDVRTYIEQGYQQNPIVESITNMVAQHVARAKWCVKDFNGDEIEVPLLNKPSKDHNVLMIDPNNLQSWHDLQEAATVHYLLEGNMFITGERGTGINSDKFNTLYHLPSEDIQIIADPGFRSIEGYKVDFAWSTESAIPATDVMHLRTPNPDFDESDNWLFGQSIFRAARRSIQAYNESLETGVWYLQNKGAQKLLYTAKDDNGELSPEAQDALKNKLRGQTQGPKNSATIPIIDYPMGVLDISTNPKEALVLEQRHQAALEICNVMNFPGQLIGLDTATYQNAKEAKKALFENCVIPILEKLKHGYNRWLAPKYGDVYLEYKLDHIDALQEDRLMRGKAVKEYAGMVTINEARQMAGLTPIDKLGDSLGDDMYVGFTQAVVNDTEEISPINGGDKEKEDGGD